MHRPRKTTKKVMWRMQTRMMSFRDRGDNSRNLKVYFLFSHTVATEIRRMQELCEKNYASISIQMVLLTGNGIYIICCEWDILSKHEHNIQLVDGWLCMLIFWNTLDQVWWWRPLWYIQVISSCTTFVVASLLGQLFGKVRSHVTNFLGDFFLWQWLARLAVNIMFRYALHAGR